MSTVVPQDAYALVINNDGSAAYMRIPPSSYWPAQWQASWGAQVDDQFIASVLRDGGEVAFWGMIEVKA